MIVRILLELTSRIDTITTLAGSRPGDEDGKGLGAKFGEPCGMCMNPNDQCLYICDYNSIRRLSMQGISPGRTTYSFLFLYPLSLFFPP